MPKNLVLLPLLFLSFIGYSQTELNLQLSAKSHPRNLSIYADMGSPAGLQLLPIADVRLGARHFFGQRKLAVEGHLSYLHTRFSRKIEWNPPQNQFDPSIPADNKFRYMLNYAGLSAGLAYQKAFSRKNQLIISAGGQLRLPFASHYQLGDGNYFDPVPIYRGDSFKHGVLYGLYLRPGLDFRFNPRSSWKFGVFAEADLLFRNQSESNPIFLWGGGLEVGYRLGKR